MKDKTIYDHLQMMSYRYTKNALKLHQKNLQGDSWEDVEYLE